MTNNSEIFNQIVDRRRAYREFDPNYDFPDFVVKNSLERAIKSPSSSNMQLWEFYRIKSKEAIKEVAEICLNQSGAKTASEIVVFVARPDLWKERQSVHLKRLENVKTKNIKNKLFGSSELSYFSTVIPQFYNSSLPLLRDFIKRIYVWSKSRKGPFMQDVYSKHIPVVTQKSTALAAQTFMLSISAEGYDSLPMEGLDSKRMRKFLKLPKSAEINMAIAVGKGMPDGLRGPRFRLAYDKVVFDI
jgi:nitroreductase